MTQALVDVALHIVFSTKNRQPLISQEIEEELFKYICGTAKNLKCPVIKINGVEDHIHLLLQFGKKMAICDLISEIKSSSSRWIKTKGDQYRHFSWQSGYGTFAVARPRIDTVIRYIAKQKEHHKVQGFKEEFIEMLIRAEIEYDEEYLWQ
jgi:REP element-mobilizing transposase RayT